MALKRKADGKSVHVVVEHIMASDAEKRLRQGYDLILRTAARVREGGEAVEDTALEEDPPKGLGGTGPGQEGSHGASCLP